MRAGEQNRDLQAASKRRITAIWKIGWMAAGLLASLVLLYLDILYSADGMIPIFGTSDASFYLCWALSILMSPIEMATTSVMTDPDQRRELGPDARTIGMGIGVLVFVADVVTNWMGLYLASSAAGPITLLNGLVIFLVGGMLAFIEYVIEFLVSLLAKEIANFKEANVFFKQWHAEHDGGAGRGPRDLSSGPRRPPMAAPMSARGDGGPRREPPRRDSGRPPTRRAM